MSNINYTTLWSDNPGKFDEIMKDISFRDSTVVKRETGKIHINTAWISSHDDIVELSFKYPNIIFFAAYSFESFEHDTLITVKYKNGKDTELKVEPRYCLQFPSEEIRNNVPCYDILEQKLIDVFRRLDIEKQNEYGERIVDWVDAEITASVIYDGYKMTGTKHHHQIGDIEVQKEIKVIKILWEDVTEEVLF